MSIYTSSVSFGFSWGMRSLCPSVDSNKPNSRSSKGHTIKYDLATVITQTSYVHYRFQMTVNEMTKDLDYMDLKEDSDCWDKISSFRWM